MHQPLPVRGKPARVSWRLGKLDFYLLRKLFAPFLLIELGTILILELERALRLIYELSFAGADIGYFLPLLLRLAPYFVNLALPLAFFLALAILLARLDDQLELQAMLAVGVSLTRIAFPLVLAGLLVSVISVATSGWLEPIGRFDFRKLKVEALNSGRSARLTPGAFFSPNRSLVVTIAPSAASGANRVFVWHADSKGHQQAITAQAATLGHSRDGQRIEMDLREGELVADDSRPGHSGAYALTFRQLSTSFPLLLDSADWQRGRDERELTTPELVDPGAERIARLGSNAMAAELYGRLGKAALIPLLPLLVLPLTMAVRRARRLPSAIAAGVLFVLALYTVNAIRQRAAVGQIAALPSTALVVASFALIGMALTAAGRNLPSHSPISVLLDRLDKVVRRATGHKTMQLALRGHVLRSYLWRQVTVWTLVSGFALVVMLEMSEIFLMGDVFVRRGMGAPQIVHYGLLRTPAQTLQALPMAALIGPIIAFLLLVRSREMMIIRLMGFSPARMLLALLPIPLALGAVSYGLSEYAVPRSQKAFLAWWQFDAPSAEPSQPHWFAVGDAIVRADGISSDARQLDGVLLFTRDAAGAITGRMEAAHAVAASGHWQLLDVRRLVVRDAKVSVNRVPEETWRTSLQPEDARVAMSAGDTYSARWARRALDGDAPASAGIAAYHTRILRQTTLPLLPLIMLMFAVPITATSQHGRGSAIAAVYAITAGSLFLLTDSLMNVMAMLGIIPAMAGVWLVPVEAAMLAMSVLGFL